MINLCTHLPLMITVIKKNTIIEISAQLHTAFSCSGNSLPSCQRVWEKIAENMGYFRATACMKLFGYK